MAITISVANHKGGVGKTTTTASLGVPLARMGHRVLLIDLDSQQNLTSSLMDEQQVEESIYDALRTGKVQPAPLEDNLWIIPADITLASADMEFGTRMAREKLLSNLLAPIQQDYDYILLDCPPSLGILTINALAASDYLLLPLTGESLPMRGLVMLDDVTQQVQAHINPDLQLLGVVLTRYNNRKLNHVVMDSLKERYGAKLLNARIRECIAVAEAPLSRTSIFDYAPDSNGAMDYAALAKEVASLTQV